MGKSGFRKTKQTKPSKRSVLVVDDDAVTRTFLLSLFQKLEFDEVIAAEDGMKAIEQLSSRDFSLVICDFHMPELSGEAVLRHVRSSMNNLRLPFIFLTAESDLSVINAILKLGVHEYLIKPVSIDDLREKVERAMTGTSLNITRLENIYVLPNGR